MTKKQATALIWGVVTVVIGGLMLNVVLRRFPNL